MAAHSEDALTQLNAPSTVFTQANLIKCSGAVGHTHIQKVMEVGEGPPGKTLGG